jgi:hypothetical protein
MSGYRWLTPSRLPVVPRPFPCEATQSYITRLAEANGLRGTPLRRYLSANDRSSLTSPERLSAVTGISPATLL